MADNVAVSGSAEFTVATDDIGGVHYPYVKLAFGSADSAFVISSAQPMPVQGADNNGLKIQDGGGSITVDNGGTPIGVQVNDTSFAVADGNALGEGILVQGDDGTDRKNIHVDATTGDVQVDVTNTVNVDGSGVTQPVSGTVTANLGATDNAVIDEIAANTSATAVAVQIIDNAISGNEMQVDVVAALPTGSNTIGNIGTIATSITPGTAAGNLGKAEDAAHSSGDTGVLALARRNDTPSSSAGTDGDYATLNVSANGRLYTNSLPVGATTGGLTIGRNIDVDESEDAIKATAGQLYWVHAINLASSVRYLKFYNATVATVVVGTTTPVLTFPIPTQGDTNGAGFTFSIPQGLAFSTAITVAATTGLADNDTGAPGANEVIINVGYV